MERQSFFFTAVLTENGDVFIDPYVLKENKNKAPNEMYDLNNITENLGHIDKKETEDLLGIDC